MIKKSPSTPKGINPSPVHRRTMRPLSLTVSKLTKSMLGRQGFTQGDIVAKWPDIVGKTISRHTLPEKIVFCHNGASDGTLHLRCSSGAMATELIHQSPQILDRINTFFGYQAVARITLIQAPLPAFSDPPKKTGRALSTAESRTLDETLATVEDEDFRTALKNIGASILIRDSHKT